MTKSSATAPASTAAVLLVSGGTKFTKRASRTGPFRLINWLTFCNCCGVGASPTCGFPGKNVLLKLGVRLFGLLPPTAGCEWHSKQLTALNEGPSPGIVAPPVCGVPGEPGTVASVSKTASA